MFEWAEHKTQSLLPNALRAQLLLVIHNFSGVNSNQTVIFSYLAQVNWRYNVKVYFQSVCTKDAKLKCFFSIINIKDTRYLVWIIYYKVTVVPRSL
jgi:hypothetical protein